MGFLCNFIVYTLAMVGVIVVALLIFKNATNVSPKGGAKFLRVVDTLSLGPRKTLYIVSAGEEKFLIAGDVDKTSLISKLESKRQEEPILNVSESFKDTMQELSAKTSYIDRSILGIQKVQNKPYNSVMKNLAERIRQ